MTRNSSRRSFLAAFGAAFALPSFARKADAVPPLLDHILLGCSDLERGVTFVEERLGVRAEFGGVHPGRGTQNALLSLGTRHYLEIIAPDPKQAGAKLPHGLGGLNGPRLVGWAAHPGDLDRFAVRLRGAGIAFRGAATGLAQNSRVGASFTGEPSRSQMTAEACSHSSSSGARTALIRRRMARTARSWSSSASPARIPHSLRRSAKRWTSSYRSSRAKSHDFARGSPVRIASSRH